MSVQQVESPETPQETKIDDAVLALLAVWAFQDGPARRSWKSFDWATLSRLHAAGFIGEPRGSAKSVVLTPEGVERGRLLAEVLFAGAGASGLPR